MKRIPILTTLLLSLLALAACQKTDDAAPDGMVEIFAESMNGGDKVVLDGLSATWRSGDAIRINGSTATVERRGDHAYISNASISEGTNRALYPASLSTVNWGTDNPVVTLPAYYHYRTDSSGHQVLELPMAAYSNSSTSPLQFKHLTGALYVTVKNTGATARTLQSVTVKSNKYALNGALNVALNTADLVAARTGTPDELFVTLVFDEEVTLANGESVRVMLPIRPVGSDNDFTIEVKSYASGQSTSYLSSKTQPSGSDHSLARNQLGYAPMDIPVGETTTPVLDYVGTYYAIRTANDFVLMTKAINNQWLSRTRSYKLMNDIDMSGYEITPIEYTGFGGVINGDGHIVRNLTINSILYGDSYRCALFCVGVSGTAIRDIEFDGLMLNHTNSTTKTVYMGAIFGYYENSSISTTLAIENCNVRYQSINVQGAGGEVRVGGLISDIEGNKAVLNLNGCHVEMPSIAVEGRLIYWGGLVGFNGNANAYISQSSWICDEISLHATSNIMAGGIMGTKGGSALSASGIKVQGRIDARSDSGAKRFVGALVGEYSANHLATIENDTVSGFSASMNGTGVESIGYWGTNLAN